MTEQAASRTGQIRTRFVNLASQQRHLRHLTGISGRNIDPNLVPPVKPGCKPGLLSLFFTLKTKDEKTEIYKSETIENSLNPSWNEFDSNAFPDGTNSSATDFTICIWAKKGKHFEAIIKRKLNLCNLHYFGDQLKPRGKAYGMNMLLFKMFGKFYTFQTGAAQGLQSDGNQDGLMSMLLKVDQNSVRWAYKKSSLLRVHCMLKAVHETKQQVRKARHQIENRLSKKQERTKKCIEREHLNRKICMVSEELKNLKENFEIELNQSSRRNLEITNKEKELSDRQDDLEQYVAEMKVCHSAHIVNRESLVKINAQLNYRRKQLAAELNYIFPVVEIPQRGSVKREFAITGVRLPASDEIMGEDDDMLSVALGNTTHLVAMMAKLIELPLRYPLRPMGSRSSVLDLVKDRLTDKEREFPLYLKGKEKYQFHYGVFLLNKNIAQLRYHCGLGTTDLRHSLSNLKHLFENKFGVRVVVRPDTETLQQRISQAPTGRAFSDTNVSDISTSPNTIDVVTPPKFKKSASGRPSSYHFDETDARFHKSSSQGNLQPKKNEKLPSLPTRTAVHELIRRKSKKRPGRSKSMPDPESPGNADRLLEVPFEDLMKGNVDKNILNGANSLAANVKTSNGDDLGFVSDNHDNHSNIINSQVGTNESTKTNLENGSNGGTDNVCAKCLREGKGSIGCPHVKNRIASIDEVSLDEKDLSDSRRYNRQFSDILLIPGPFEDQDRLGSPDDSNGNVL